MSSDTRETKTWLITGCSQGLGRALAEAALESGHCVVLTARQTQSIDELAARYPDSAMSVRLDVTDAAAIAAAVQETQARFGGLDILVNNAGYGFAGAVEETRPDEYRQLFDTNVFGSIEMIRAVLPVMRKQKAGHIINISSMGGILAHAGVAYYCATKFAIEGLSEALQGEVGPFGIGVTIVEPGAFSTNFRGSLRSATTILDDYAATSGAVREILGRPPAQKQGDPRKAGTVIVDMVERGEAPLRLALGEDCLGAFAKKISMLDQSRAEGEQLLAMAGFYHADRNSAA
jgi:NAD(P)-dependent dehydrogenase (short-subunit alcohol dehydrogenase family)